MLEPKQLQSILQIGGSGGLEVLYLGYVETHLRTPEVKAFDQDILLLIVPNSAHTICPHHFRNSSYWYGNKIGYWKGIKDS